MTKNKVEKMDEVTKESVLEALASMESGRPAVVRLGDALMMEY